MTTAAAARPSFRPFFKLCAKVVIARHTRGSLTVASAMRQTTKRNSCLALPSWFRWALFGYGGARVSSPCARLSSCTKRRVRPRDAKSRRAAGGGYLLGRPCGRNFRISFNEVQPGDEQVVLAAVARPEDDPLFLDCGPDCYIVLRNVFEAWQIVFFDLQTM
jgi:hypothetical protein